MSQCLYAFHSFSRFCSCSPHLLLTTGATTDGAASATAAGPNPGAAEDKTGDAAEAWRGDGTDAKEGAAKTARRFQQDGRVRD